MAQTEFNHEIFSKEVYDDQMPFAFGTCEYLYEQMLQESAMLNFLRRAVCPRVLLVGSTKESAEEFVRFLDSINNTARIFIVDIKQAPLKSASGQFSQSENLTQRRVNFIQADATRVAISNGSLDVAFTHWLLHNLDSSSYVSCAKARNVIKEIHRVLRPGGGIFLVERSFAWHHSLGDSEPDYMHIATQALSTVGFRDASSVMGSTISRKEYGQRYGLDNRLYGGETIIPGNVASFGIKS